MSARTGPASCRSPPNGSTCDDGSDCQSGYCVNDSYCNHSFCCEAGICCGTDGDCPAGEVLASGGDYAKSYGLGVGSGHKAAQTIVSPVTASLTRVALCAYDPDGPATMQVDVRAQTYDGASLGTSFAVVPVAKGWVDFEFTPTVALAEGEAYAIVVTAGASDFLNVGGTGSSEYPDGLCYTLNPNSGAGWIESAADDVVFRAYVWDDGSCVDYSCL